MPDFGTVTGVTLLGTIREGTTTTYYYDREEVEAGDKILLRYYAALGENTFYQFTGGSFTSSSTAFSSSALVAMRALTVVDVSQTTSFSMAFLKAMDKPVNS